MTPIDPDLPAPVLLDIAKRLRRVERYLGRITLKANGLGELNPHPFTNVDDALPAGHPFLLISLYLRENIWDDADLVARRLLVRIVREWCIARAAAIMATTPVTPTRAIGQSARRTPA